MIAKTTPEQKLIGLLEAAEALEDKISYRELNATHREGTPPTDHEIEADLELRQPFAELLEDLHRQTAFLIEARGLTSFLEAFHKKFGNSIDGYHEAHQFDSDYLSHPQLRSVFLTKLRQFLRPLNIVEEGLDDYRVQSGLLYLERVLDGTARLLKDREITPSSEPEIYREIRKLMVTLFPSAADPPPGRFIKTCKYYRPDLLIPELHTAVEYKYLNTEGKLTSAFGQIADDVHGYRNDPDYKYMYAVFYQTQDFWGRERCETVWKNYEFPDYWRAIFVVGEGT